MKQTKNAIAVLAAAALLAACAAPAPQGGERFRNGEAMAPMAARGDAAEHPARRVRGDAPISPIGSVLSGTPGFACVSMNVDEQGHVHDVKVLKASEAIFGVHAAHAVKDWVFEPALHDGRPVATSLQQSFWFNADHRDLAIEAMHC